MHFIDLFRRYALIGKTKRMSAERLVNPFAGELCLHGAVRIEYGQLF